MKVSLISVTYNSEKYIRSCIESVIAQSYKDVEYIIVDGASTDSTIQIVESYGAAINHIISEPDKGIYDAINKGIKVASGDVIGILNSDDFLSNQHVLKQIADEFIKNKNLDAIYADVAFVERTNGEKVLRYYSSQKFRPWMFRFGFQPAHPTFYAKKSVFEKFGLYRIDMKIAGDFELLARFISRNKIRVKYIKQQFVNMRIGGVSTSGLKSVVLLNSEIINALKINKIYTNKVFVYSKYLFKWWGYVFK
ncbi:MAG: glycosyltransferase [Pedobacter sp.]|nr:MAG: glycosyltransferase [Pedobacter sp.]